MARYINADELINEIKDLPVRERIELMGIYDVIRNQPPADVQEVKHGKWEYIFPTENTIGCYKCSKCECHMWGIHDNEYPYCPWCGAKMDGE